MKQLISKSILFLLCLISVVTEEISIYLISAFFITLLFSFGLDLIKPIKFRFGFCLIYIALSFIIPDLVVFMPILVYDFFIKEKPYFSLIFVFSFIQSWIHHENMMLTITLVLLAIILKIKDSTLQKTKDTHLSLINTANERNISLILKNKTMKKHEHTRTTLAILKERDRIAKNIHDDVGHLITRSLLQIGALLLTIPENNENLDSENLQNSDNKTDTLIAKTQTSTLKSAQIAELNKQLHAIKDNLDIAMMQIRQSVHKLHEDSIVLETEISNLTNDFPFCPVLFEYNLSTKLPENVVVSLIYIVKECLTNVMKHSSATQVKISFNELDSKFTFLIIDNGNTSSITYKEGLGLPSIKERVASFGGTLNISTNNGFRILIILNKEAISCV